MAREWIYLDEAGADKAPSETELKQTNADTRGANTTVSAQQQTTRQLDDSQKTHMQMAKFHAGKMKDELMAAKDEYIQKKASKIAEKKAAALSSKAEDTSLLDEENDDASIIDNKSKEEQDKEVKPEDIKNEKQPLNEFMDVFKQISR